jgi:hypothetical protein
MATINMSRAVMPTRQAISSTASQQVSLATSAPVINTAQLQNEIETRAQQIASELIKTQAQQSQIAASGRVFTRFDVTSDVIDNQKTYVTTGLFSGNQPSLSVMYTGSLQTTSSKNYYYEVYNDSSSISEPQFSIAWGHKYGSGSSAAGTLNDSPTRAIYSQYKNILLSSTDTQFTFYG